MKRSVGLIAWCLLFNSSFLLAQNKARGEEPKVLFGGEKTNISGFGGIIVEFSSIGGDASIMNGGGGAGLFNKRIFLGGYGISLSNEIQKPASGISRNVDFRHGGLYTGYIIQPHKLVHFGVSSRLGWGAVRLTPENAFLSSVGPISDNVLVWVPQAEVEMNFSYWFKVSAGMGYRIVSGINNPVYQNNEFNSPSLTLSFLFGWFK